MSASGSDRKIEVLEIYDADSYDDFELRIKAKDLYRVVCHKADGTEEIDDELVTAGEAIQWAEIMNGCCLPGHDWYEAVSYQEAFKREKFWDEHNHFNERVEKEVARRLAARNGKKVGEKKSRRVKVK